MVTLEHRTLLHLPTLYTFEEDGVNYAVDPAKPNWIAVDGKGRELLDAIAGSGGKVTFGVLVARYAAAHQLEAGKAWVHVHDFLQALNRAGILADGPVSPPPYPGRAALIAPEGLRELWIQINNACNLSCTHCLVSSGPGKDPGLPFQRLRALVDRAEAVPTVVEGS